MFVRRTLDEDLEGRHRGKLRREGKRNGRKNGSLIWACPLIHRSITFSAESIWQYRQNGEKNRREIDCDGEFDGLLNPDSEEVIHSGPQD